MIAVVGAGDRVLWCDLLACFVYYFVFGWVCCFYVGLLVGDLGFLALILAVVCFVLVVCEWFGWVE